MIFENRAQAGKHLADLLDRFRGEDSVVLGLPRGGVVVAYPIAMALGAPLDVLVVRKLGAPFQPELGVGAIGPFATKVLDEANLARLGIAVTDMQPVIDREQEELERRIREYRGGNAELNLTGKTVIVVDDGLATGVTAEVAVKAVKSQNPGKIILAAPVCAQESATRLGQQVDELVCGCTPTDFRAVGLWYEEFGQTSDEEVLALLQKARLRYHAADRP